MDKKTKPSFLASSNDHALLPATENGAPRSLTNT